MKCEKCNGTGNAKDDHKVVLRLPTMIVKTPIGRILFGRRIPGKIREVTKCKTCKGKGWK